MIAPKQHKMSCARKNNNPCNCGLKRTAIRVWDFENAPKKFQKLSPHGGDEDWVAHIPLGYVDDWIGWLERGSSFGCCRVSEHYQKDGSVVKIGAHA